MAEKLSYAQYCDLMTNEKNGALMKISNFKRNFPEEFESCREDYRAALDYIRRKPIKEPLTAELIIKTTPEAKADKEFRQQFDTDLVLWKTGQK